MAKSVVHASRPGHATRHIPLAVALSKLLRLALPLCVALAFIVEPSDAKDVSSQALPRSLATTPSPILLPISLVAPVCDFPAKVTTLTFSSARIGKTKWKGFGTSLGWYANYIGGFPAAQLNPILDLLFNKTGLGLNIVRFNIGGGFNPTNSPQFNTESYIKYRGVPGYKTAANKPYDFTRDANQRAVLLGAKARGANLFVAFSMSPPWFYTISGDVSGNRKGAPNLQPSAFQGFADYLADVVQAYSKNYGVNFQYLQPFYEPSSLWYRKGTQEGCSYTKAEGYQLLPLISSSLKARKLNTSIVINNDRAPSVVDWAGSLGSDLANIVDHLEAKSYETNTSDPIGSILSSYSNVAAAAVSLKKEAWISEWGPLNVDTKSSQLGTALYMARTIIQAVNYMRASAWVYWQALDPFSHWAMIEVPWDSKTTYSLSTNKKFSVLKHFTSQVPPGSYPVNVTAIRRNCYSCIVGFYSPCLSQVTFFVVNQESTDKKLKVVFRGFKRASPKVRVKHSLFRTSATEDALFIKSLRIGRGGSISFVAKSQSLTSIVISSIQSRSKAQNACLRT